MDILQNFVAFSEYSNFTLKIGENVGVDQKSAYIIYEWPLRPAISSGSVHKSHSQIFVQDDMVLLNNARSSVFNHTMSAARSVNDLDQLPPMSAHQLSQNTLPAYRY